MDSQKFIPVTLPALLVFAVLPLMASAAASAAEIEEIVVTASLLHRNADSNATPLHIVDETTLAGDPVMNLGDALDSLLGVTTADYGSGVGQPVIRGLSGSRVRVLQNGMVSRDVAILGGDHINEIDLTDAQQIEVIRGPASLFFANGTVGGVVNIVDHAIAQEDLTALEFRLSGETQSVNDGDALSVAVRNNVGGVNFSYAGSYSNLNDYKVPLGALVSEGHHEDDHDDSEHGDEADEDHGDLETKDYVSRLANSDTERETHLLGFSKTGDWGYVGLSYGKQASVYGIPVHADEHGEEHEDEGHADSDHLGEAEHEEEHEEKHGEEHGAEERIFSSTESRVTTLEGRFDFDNSLLNSLSAHLRNSDYQLLEQHGDHDGDEQGAYDGHEGHDEGPTLFSNESIEVGLKFNFDSEDASHRLVLNLADEDIAITGEEVFLNPNQSREMTAGYYFSREFGDAFHVDFGARLDKINREGTLTHHDEEQHQEEGHDDKDHEEDGHDGEEHHDSGEIESYDLDFTTTSFAGTVSRSFGEYVDLSVGLSSVERTPSAVELFIDGPHLAAQRYEVGDVRLVPERSRNTEISIAYERAALFGRFTAFNNQIDDYIYLQDESEIDHDADHDHGSLILGNYVQSDARFTGFEVELGAELSLPFGLIRMSIGRDQTRAEFDKGGFVPRISPARNLMAVAGSFKHFDATIRYQDVDRQSRTAQNELATNSYESLNVNFSKTFDLGPAALQATLFGRNLLDDVARRHTSFVKEQAPLPGRNVGLKLTLARE